MKFDLEALKAKNLPPCKHETIGFDVAVNCPAGPLRDEAMKARATKLELADKYLKNFVYLDGLCPGCDKHLGGPGGTFGWASLDAPGTATGEGGCTNCGYPARAHHPMDEVMGIKHFALAYHPSVLVIKE